MLIRTKGNQVLYDGKNARQWAEELNASYHMCDKLLKENFSKPQKVFIAAIEAHYKKYPRKELIVAKECADHDSLWLRCFHSAGGFKTRLTPFV